MTILIKVGAIIGILMGIAILLMIVAGVGCAAITKCIDLIERWVEKHG